MITRRCGVVNAWSREPPARGCGEPSARGCEPSARGCGEPSARPVAGSRQRAVAGAISARDCAGHVDEAGRAPPRGGSTRPASTGDGWLPVAVAVVVAVVMPVTTVVMPVAKLVPGAVVVAHVTVGPAGGHTG